ncbi:MULTISPECIES: YybH family protein [unclassified Methylophaga]|jgi:uncharacterized protein (TIGR02246 family)|uniref:YybH family protein n=1 Tax=unclassified Methylophaga TaxID=2629249 RepID=UPI00259CDFDD|nr:MULTISPECIES: DUF4440 domain-containing protein [unclassified Methylophaga]|tara:strand:+ start:800 stop:1246 length:447 start_codon:yes stop_codon:yes gene_type:complete
MKKFLVFLFSMFSIQLPVVAEELSVNNQVDFANAQWNKAFNAGDVDALTQLYKNDATLSPGNGAILKGRDAIGQLFQSFVDNGVTNHRIDTDSIYVSDNQITQIGYWQADGKNAEGEKISFGGVLSLVLAKTEEGEWVIQSHIWNMQP